MFPLPLQHFPLFFMSLCCYLSFSSFFSFHHNTKSWKERSRNVIFTHYWSTFLSILWFLMSVFVCFCLQANITRGINRKKATLLLIPLYFCCFFFFFCCGFGWKAAANFPVIENGILFQLSLRGRRDICKCAFVLLDFKCSLNEHVRSANSSLCVCVFSIVQACNVTARLKQAAFV